MRSPVTSLRVRPSLSGSAFRSFHRFSLTSAILLSFMAPILIRSSKPFVDRHAESGDQAVRLVRETDDREHLRELRARHAFRARGGAMRCDAVVAAVRH